MGHISKLAFQKLPFKWPLTVMTVFHTPTKRVNVMSHNLVHCSPVTEDECCKTSWTDRTKTFFWNDFFNSWTMLFAFWCDLERRAQGQSLPLDSQTLGNWFRNLTNLYRVVLPHLWISWWEICECPLVGDNGRIWVKKVVLVTKVVLTTLAWCTRRESRLC